MKYNFQIFCGHFGSGKTETALNFAFKQRDMRREVIIVDLDIVNPYFRANDAKYLLKERGIKLIANDYASSNLDMPTMPLNLMSAFEDENSIVIFDVGGDDDGALALGAYKELFVKNGYEMHFVVNTKRPLTKTKGDLIEIAQRIENASGLKFTDIYNNTNISWQTDEKTLFSGYDEIEKTAKLMNIPVAKNCGLKNALLNVPEELADTKFEIELNILKPWEIK